MLFLFLRIAFLFDIQNCFSIRLLFSETSCQWFGCKQNATSFFIPHGPLQQGDGILPNSDSHLESVLWNAEFLGFFNSNGALPVWLFSSSFGKPMRDTNGSSQNALDLDGWNGINDWHLRHIGKRLSVGFRNDKQSQETMNTSLFMIPFFLLVDRNACSADTLLRCFLSPRADF